MILKDPRSKKGKAHKKQLQAESSWAIFSNKENIIIAGHTPIIKGIHMHLVAQWITYYPVFTFLFKILNPQVDFNMSIRRGSCIRANRATGTMARQTTGMTIFDFPGRIRKWEATSDVSHTKVEVGRRDTLFMTTC